MKVRIDKKVDCPILVPGSLFPKLRRLSGIGDASLMFTAHSLIMTAFEDEDCITTLAPYFKRAYTRSSHAWFGGFDTPSYKPLLGPRHNPERVHVRLSRKEWDALSELSHSLAAPLAHTLCLLLTLKLKEAE